MRCRRGRVVSDRAGSPRCRGRSIRSRQGRRISPRPELRAYSCKMANSTSLNKDAIIDQLKARIEEQAEIIELLKQQLTVKDEQIATANRIADQAQQLDLTTHNQAKLPQKTLKKEQSNERHGWLWLLDKSVFLVF